MASRIVSIPLRCPHRESAESVERDLDTVPRLPDYCSPPPASSPLPPWKHAERQCASRHIVSIVSAGFPPMTAAMASGQCVKLWFGEVSRQTSIGPQAQSSAHSADSDAQFFTLQAVQAAPAPAPMVGREPSQAMAAPESGDSVPESEDPREPPDDELHPCAATVVTAKPKDNQAPNLIASILGMPHTM